MAVAALAPFTAGYIVTYLFRAINGSASGMAAELGLAPSDFVALSAAFFLTAAVSQVPAGLLVDRFGARRMQVALMLVIMTGCLMSARAHGLAGLLVARAVLGAGCSGFAATAMKAIAVRLPVQHRATAGAAFVVCGGLGTMAATLPASLPGAVGWRGLFLVVALFASLVATLLWMTRPEAAARSAHNGRDVLSGLKQVACDGRFWGLAVVSTPTVAAALAMQGLWGGRWLTEVARPCATGPVLTLAAMAVPAGAAVFGTLSARLRRRGRPQSGLLAGATLVMIGVELLTALGAPIAPGLLLSGWTLFAAIQAVSFALATALLPPALAGCATALLNAIHMVGTILMQAGIGVVVGLWKVNADGHAPACAYTAAFASVAAVQILALTWFTLSRRPSE